MFGRGPDLVERAAARLRRPAVVGEPQMPREKTEVPQSAPLRTNLPQNPVRNDAAFSGPPSVSLSPTTLAAQGIVLPSSDFSRTVQEFRALKRQVLSPATRHDSGNEAHHGRAVLVTSARAGEGKTFTAINLALAIAQEKDTHVLLLDADPYRQSALRYLGINAESGWLDYVTGTRIDLDGLMIHTNIGNLSVLPAGAGRAGVPELMSSGQMRDMIEALMPRNASRVVIIDSVPCLTSTEPSILAGLADQTLFVVAAHQTARDEIETSLRLLNGSPSVSLVLNRTHPVLAEQFRGYAYSYAGRR